MKRIINVVREDEMLKEYETAQEMEEFIEACHGEGVEYIRAGGDERGIIRKEKAIGCHLIFFSDWVDFWRGDREAIERKFGTEEVIEWVYGTRSREGLISRFKEDFDIAEEMGVEYAVFHVSDVSIAEGYSYKWEHSDREVIDAAAELLNLVTKGCKYSFKLLLENLWWKGFSFTKAEDTEYMLERIEYSDKGIMLDTGHLMNTNLELRNEEEACEYIHRMLDNHGDLCEYIKGVHLHKSISGEYVKESIKKEVVHESDYAKSIQKAYPHILRIDEHKPFTAAGVKDLVGRIAPEYLVYELSARDRAEKIALCDIQHKALE